MILRMERNSLVIRPDAAMEFIKATAFGRIQWQTSARELRFCCNEESPMLYWRRGFFSPVDFASWCW